MHLVNSDILAFSWQHFLLCCWHVKITVHLIIVGIPELMKGRRWSLSPASPILGERSSIQDAPFHTMHFPLSHFKKLFSNCTA